MTNRWFIAPMFFLATLAASCDSTSPTSLSDPYAGVWLGPITDQASGAGTLRFELSAQPGGGLIGTWTATFSNPANNNGGTLSATVPLGPPLEFGLDCNRMGVALFTMTMNGNRMTGTYGTVTCNGLTRGTAELTKQ